MRSNRVLLVMTAILITPILAGAWADTVYRWVDQNGQVHYSQSPPSTASKAQAVEVKAKPPDPAALQQTESLEQYSGSYAKTQQKQAAQLQREAAKRARQQQRCDAARKQLQQYLTATPALPEATADVMGYYPSNDALVRKHQQAQARVDKICKGL